MNREGIAGGAISLLAIPFCVGCKSVSSAQTDVTRAVKMRSNSAHYSDVTRHRMIPSKEDLRREKLRNDLTKEAYSFVHKQQWVKAEAKFREAAEMSSGEYPPPAISLGLAQCLESEGRLQEALVTMRPGLFGEFGSFGNYSASIVHYAELAEKLGNSKEASMAYSEAVKSRSTSSDFEGNVPKEPTDRQIRALAYVCAGQDLDGREDGVAKTKASYRKALAIDPDCILAHLYFAQSLRRIPEAKKHFAFVVTHGIGTVKKVAELGVWEVQALENHAKARKELQAKGLLPKD